MTRRLFNPAALLTPLLPWRRKSRRQAIIDKIPSDKDLELIRYDYTHEWRKDKWWTPSAGDGGYLHNSQDGNPPGF